MARRPRIEAALTTNGEVVLLVEPIDGIARVVNSVYCYNIDLANRIWGLYLDDGSDHYQLQYVTLAPGDHNYFPLDGNPGPVVVPYGYSLNCSSDAKNTEEMEVSVHYTDHAPDGEATSNYGLGVAKTEAHNTYVTLVEQPADGMVRLIRNMTYFNDDSINHFCHWSLYDIANTTYYEQWNIELTPAGKGSPMRVGDQITLPHGWRLSVYQTTIKTDGPVHWTAHYLETRETDSGEG